jgi:hypothetical protein
MVIRSEYVLFCTNYRTHAKMSKTFRLSVVYEKLEMVWEAEEVGNHARGRKCDCCVVMAPVTCNGGHLESILRTFFHETAQLKTILG